jgi:outer membrane protein assembly factor BamB
MGQLYCLELGSGKVIWSAALGGPIAASPAITDRHLVIGTQDGLLYCFGQAAER